jgi:hypothetical protein
MPRSVAEIQAEIAKVKQEIAARDMYRQPQSQVGWGSYIVDGDRGMLDAYQNREDQYNKMMKQQAFQAAEAALNRKFQEAEAVKNRENALKIAGLSKEAGYNDKIKAQQKEQEKELLAAELAQAEYDDAINKVDMSKPETILAARKAAIKLNYANRSLPYYADDPQSFTVATEFTEDAEPVKINKAVNTAIQTLDPIVASPTKLWNKEQKAAYNEAFEVIKKYRPDLIPKYQIEAAKKGKTVDEAEAAYQADLKAAGNSPAKIALVKKKHGRK